MLSAVFAAKEGIAKDSYIDVKDITEAYMAARDKLAALANDTADSDPLTDWLTEDDFADLAMGQLNEPTKVALANDLLDTMDYQDAAMTHADQQTIADFAVGLVELAGDGSPEPVTLEALTHVSITGLDATLMPAFHHLVAQTSEDGSGVDTRQELETLVTDAQQLQTDLLAQIKAYADDPENNPAPDQSTFDLAGITGVNGDNLAGIDSVLASLPIDADATDSIEKTQAIVDAYTRVNDDLEPSLADYELLGIEMVGVVPTQTDDTGVGDAAGQEEQSYWESGPDLFNDLLHQDAVAKPLTHSYIQATADFVAALADVADAQASGNHTDTLVDADAFVQMAADFGLITLEDLALEPFLQLVHAESTDLTDYNALVDLAQRANTQAAALRGIVQYAQDSQVTPIDGAPAIDIFETAGIEGLAVYPEPTVDEDGNVVQAEGTENILLHEAVISALSTSAVLGEDVDTAAKLQSVVDGFAHILMFSAMPDAADSVEPTTSDYQAVGAMTAGALSDHGIALLNDIVANKPVTTIASTPMIESLAATVDGLMAMTGGGPELGEEALGALHELGLRSLDTDDLEQFYNLLASSTKEEIDSVEELRGLAMEAARLNALERLRVYADDPDNQPAPTRRDYQLNDIAVDDPLWIDAFNDALAGDSLVLDADNAQALTELQSITDAYGAILSEANGSLADVDSDSDPSAGEFAAVGASRAQAVMDGANDSPKTAALFMDALKDQETGDVAQVADLDNLATAATRLMESILSPDQDIADPVTTEDFDRLGISGVSAFNLETILVLLQGPEAVLDEDGVVTEPRKPIDQFTDIRDAVAVFVNRLPLPSSLDVALDGTPPGAIRGGPLPVADNVVTVHATLDIPVDPDGGRYLVYGRLDGVGGTGITDGDGWLVLNGENAPSGVTWDQNRLTWEGAELEAGAGKAIQLKVVEFEVKDDGSEEVTDEPTGRESAIRTQSYRYIDPTRFQNLELPVLEIPGFDTVAAAQGLPADAVQLKVSIEQGDVLADVGAVRLVLTDNLGNPREIPSLFHAATGSLIPLSALPQGDWNLSYSLIDLAGTETTRSTGLQVNIVAPQNVLSNEDPFGHNVEAGIVLDSIARDRLAIRGESNDLIIDATGNRVDAIREINADPVLTAGGAMRAETQMDLVAAESVDNEVLTMAQQDLLNRFGYSAFDAFQAMDLVRFRLYPQTMIDSGTVSVDDQLNFADRVRAAYTGVLHQVDVQITDSNYAVDEFEARYYKIYPDGRVEHFDWDPVTGTGAVAQDTTGDGNYDLFSLFIREGGRGDVDGVADGVVLDPGVGVFFRATSPAVPGTAMPPNIVNEAGLVDKVGDTLGSSRSAQAMRTTDLFAPGWAMDDSDLRRISSLFQEIQRSDFRDLWQGFELTEQSFFTSEMGFQLQVFDSVDDRLTVYRGQPDLSTSAGVFLDYQIEKDVFVHAEADAVVSLKLSQVDGQPLPAWVQFNGKTGRLLINPPEGFSGDLVLRLVAVDQKGREAVTIFRVNIRDDGQMASGRMSFGDKIKESMQSMALSFLQPKG